LGKRIRDPTSDHNHDVNHHHNDHDRCTNHHDDYNGCANDYDYNEHNVDHDHDHGRANDHYFLICPVVKALRLSWLIY
jgi:ABC-type Zn2+ transport system substrate-binding protein/surface adhesin